MKMKKFIGVVGAVAMAGMMSFGTCMVGAEEVTKVEEAEMVLGEKTENAISMEISNGTNGNITFFNVVEVKDIETEEGKKQLQEALKGKNLYEGEIDGSVGPMTMEAVAKFNKDSGLGDKATLEESVVMALGGDAEDNMLPEGTRFESGATATLYVTPSEEVKESAEEVTIDETLATAANSVKYMAITKFEGNENLAFIHVLPIGEAETFEVRYDKGIVFVAYENEEGEEVTTYDLEYQYRVEQFGEEETKAMVEEATKAETKAMEEGVQNPIQPIGYTPTTPVVDETTLPEAPHALTDEGRTNFVLDDNGNMVIVPDNQETTTQQNTQPQDYDHNKYEMGPDGQLYEKIIPEGNNPMEVNDPVPEPEVTTTVEQPKEKVWVVDKAAYTETIEVVDQAAWTETIEHPEEGHYETKVVQEAYDEPQYTTVGLYQCDCGFVGTGEELAAHCASVPFEEFDYHSGSYDAGTKQVQTGTVHHDAVTEQVWVVDKAAWTETKDHPAVTHTETINHPEEGHWE